MPTRHDSTRWQRIQRLGAPPAFSRARWALSIAAITLCSVCPAGAQGFLKKMPDSARVRRDIRGSDDVDTAARQYGALNVLYRTLTSRYLRSSILHEPLPPAAQARMTDYEAAMKTISQAVHAQHDSEASRRFGTLIQRNYQPIGGFPTYSTPFEREILEKYFTPEWLADYAAAIRSTPTTVPSAQRETEIYPHPVATFGVLFGLCIAVLGGVYFMRHRGHGNDGTSEYSKKRDGSYVTFAVRPAKPPKVGDFILIGIFLVVLASVGFLGYLVPTTPTLEQAYREQNQKDTALGFAMLAGGGLLFWLGSHVDFRPRSHRVPRQFHVSPDSVEVDGRTFAKADIHRLVIVNGIQGGSSELLVAGPSNAARIARREQLRKSALVCYGFALESGGKGYLLAGGMDETTVNGLAHEACRVLKFS